MDIYINDLPYVCDSIKSSKFDQWPDQFRTTGDQLREDRIPFPLWVPQFSAGMGRRWWDPEESSYYFGNCATYHGKITLPRRTESCPFNPVSSTAEIKAFTDLEGETYALILDGAVAKCAKWDNINEEWDIVGTVLAANCDGAYDLVTYKNYLFAVCDDNGTLHTYDSSDNGANWAANADASLSGIGPASMLSSNTFSPFGAAADEIYLATWDSANNKIEVFKTTDAAANWTSICEIYSEYGPKGLVWSDLSDNDEVIIQTAEGMHIVEAVPTQFVDSRLYPSFEDSYGIVFWNSILVGHEGKGGVVMVEYKYESDVASTVPIGIDKRDQFPADYLGYVTDIKTFREALYVAVKGDKYSGIYCNDGSGWHPVYVGDDNTEVITRMWLTGTPGHTTLFFTLGANKHRFIRRLELDPAEDTSMEFEETGYIDFPYFGGRLTEMGTGFYSVRIYADNLVDDAEEVDVYWRPLYKDNFRLLGTFNKSNTYLSFVIPPHKTDVSSQAAQWRLGLRRRSGEYTYTPIIHHVSIEYQQLMGVLRAYTFTIDLLATQGLYGRDVFDEVRALQTENTLVDLQYKYTPDRISVYLRSVDIVENNDTATVTFLAITTS